MVKISTEIGNLSAEKKEDLIHYLWGRSGLTDEEMKRAIKFVKK